MKTLSFLILSVFIFVFYFSLPLGAEKAEHKDGSQMQGKAGSVGNKICPVSGAKINSGPYILIKRAK